MRDVVWGNGASSRRKTYADISILAPILAEAPLASCYYSQTEKHVQNKHGLERQMDEK